MAPTHLSWPARTGSPFMLYATTMSPSLSRRSAIEDASASMALISEAAVIMKPLSCGTPPSARPPRPTTILRSSLLLVSTALRHTTLVGSMFSSFPLAMWFSTMADSRLCADDTACMSPVKCRSMSHIG